MTISDISKLEPLLLKFRDGEVDLETVKEAVQDYQKLNFKFAPGLRISEGTLDGIVEIPFGEEHLIKAMQRYLSNEISEKELSDWAAFIQMSMAFVPMGATKEEMIISIERPVWRLIHKLIVPEIFEKLTKEVVRKYIRELQEQE